MPLAARHFHFAYSPLLRHLLPPLSVSMSKVPKSPFTLRPTAVAPRDKQRDATRLQTVNRTGAWRFEFRRARIPPGQFVTLPILFSVSFPLYDASIPFAMHFE
jgi:hypothetical protein